MAHTHGLAFFKIQKLAKIFIIALFLIITVGVATADRAELYEAVSLRSPSGCSVPYFENCEDEDFTDQLSRYTQLNDGDVSTYAELRSSTNANQLRVIRAGFELDGLRNGDYRLRMYLRGTGGNQRIPAGTNVIIRFYDDHTQLNASSEIVFQITDVADSTADWFEFNIADQVVQHTHTEHAVPYHLNMRIISNNQIYMSELRLYQPPLIVDGFNILDNGVVLTAANNQTVEHAWNVLFFDPLNATDITCDVFDVNTNTVMAVNEMDAQFHVLTQRFVVRWKPDPDLGFEELNSYRITCQGIVSMLADPQIYFEAEGFTQYVYITAEQTSLSRLQTIINYVLSIFGILNTTAVEETGAFDNIVVDISDASGMFGEQKHVSVVASTMRLAFSDSNCYLDAYGPESQWLNNVSMIPTGNEGIHTLNVTLPEQIGSHRIISRCTGGQLNQTIIRGTTTWNVFDGIRMVMLT